MTEVQIRRAGSSDLSALMAMDHSCQTDYVWQMDVPRVDGESGAVFREVRLPRTVSVPYPRDVSGLAESINRRTWMLVAVIREQPIAYIRMSDAILPQAVWITDLVVSPRFRRQGIGSGLVLAAHTWAMDRKDIRALIEMPSKDYPAICLARKLGYEFCGYNDQYYGTQDIALFFWRSLR